MKFSDLETQLEEQLANSPDPESFTGETVEPAGPQAASVTDRQEQIKGFDQAAIAGLTVLLVGAGAVGGEIGEGLVRKGVGELSICDEDIVDVTNLNRQKFREADIGENKAIALARYLAREGTQGTEIRAYPYHFQDLIALGYKIAPDIVVCAPDNDEARSAVAAHFLRWTPVVTTGLDLDALGGYVFVQEPDGACFRCFKPTAGGGGACPGVPATIDPTKTVAGIALYAVDSTVMARYRTWNLYEFYLSGEIHNMETVNRREDCPLCGGDDDGGG